ncbi:MAG: SGNH/GDSL hydrolase family protein [Chloroflexota bacterium]
MRDARPTLGVHVRATVLLSLLALTAAGCAAPAPTPGRAQGDLTPTSTSFQPLPLTPTPEPPTATSLPTATPTLAPDAWRDFSVIPTVSERARRIYQQGLALGNDPHAFSVVGDCEGTPSRFLGVFDYSTRWYRLGQYAYLQEVIDHFAGSFGRISRAAHSGFTTAAVLSPAWANAEVCRSGETPLECELRLHRPSIALVMVGTMDYRQPDLFEEHMRRILEVLIENGVVPILYTKASNLEGDWRINATVARLAYEYDLPLWNFWRAVQPLPNHGLRDDGMHVTWGPSFFDSPTAMANGWPWRNLTALQALDAVWRAVTGKPGVEDPDGLRGASPLSLD